MASPLRRKGPVLYAHNPEVNLCVSIKTVTFVPPFSHIVGLPNVTGIFQDQVSQIRSTGHCKHNTEIVNLKTLLWKVLFRKSVERLVILTVYGVSVSVRSCEVR